MKIHIAFCALLLAILLMAFITLKDFVATGEVMNEKGVPLQAASVMIKGTQTGTVTDQQGLFTLSVPGRKATLVISSLGYEGKEVPVHNGEKIHVTLKPSQNKYEEVIIGYGIKRQGVIPDRMQSAASVAASPLPGSNQFGYERKARNGSRDFQPGFDREGYDPIEENRFLKVNGNPLSTFSIDVDAASYSNIRRMLLYDQLPPAGAVRIEEMINYFPYRYAQPTGEAPFSLNTEIAACPWNSTHRLVSIGLQGRKLPTENLPPSNLTFLIDVSGSMQDEDKLPLVKASLKLLTEQLRAEDRVSIVVYAGRAGLVLPPTPGTDKITIINALDRLEAGGSTAGGQGIELAYRTAALHFMQPGNNRVILCTDGDFNIGLSSDDALERLIGEKRKSGIFLTVLGFGRGNYQDAKMQKLADKGNGHHDYIDNLNEARKVLVNEFGGTLFTIAKDVKLQIEFNPAKVQGYRLIGYENRLLAKEDFNNDKNDAGELGSGHTVTALYELIPAGVKSAELEPVDDLKYQQPGTQKVGPFGGELMNIKLRYKQPSSEVSKLLQHPVMDETAGPLSDNLRLAAAVAQFGMLLRNSPFKGTSSYALTEQMAATTLQDDPEGYRKEFVELVKKAHRLCKGADQAIR